MKTTMQKIGWVALLAATMGLNTQALSLTPSSPAVAYGPDNSQPSLSEIRTATGNNTLVEAYKQDAGGGESGFASGWYETTFAPTDQEAEDALIVHVSGQPAINSSDIYLLVKDGNHSPYWYLFDISGWNGVEDIELTGFWEDKGAISNIAIYSGQGRTNVPDGGATAILLGLGFLGLAAYRKLS